MGALIDNQKSKVRKEKGFDTKPYTNQSGTRGSIGQNLFSKTRPMYYYRLVMVTMENIKINNVNYITYTLFRSLLKYVMF